MHKDLLAQMQAQMRSYSKSQKRIAQYIIDHFDKAAFMTAFKLGDRVGVSESTVVRFATEVGFEGYPQLQKALQEMIRNRLTSLQRMEVTTDQIGDHNVLDRVLNLDIEKIKRTMEETSREDFEAAVEAIIHAKNIYIIGVRSAFALANFLSFYFTHIFDNVRLVNTSSTSEMFEQLLRIGPGDVFLPISFPRYSKRTVQASKYAKDSGASVIGITDSKTSPMAEYCDQLLLARSDMVSFVDSLVAPLSLINALIVAVGLKKRDEIAQSYAKLERIWDTYNVYQKSTDGEDIAPKGE